MYKYHLNFIIVISTFWANSAIFLIYFGADDFVVAEGGREVGWGLAGAFPWGGGGDWGEVFVGEALELRPDSGVEDADYYVVGVVGVGPEAKGVGEAEEARGVGGVGMEWLEIWILSSFLSFGQNS